MPRGRRPLTIAQIMAGIDPDHPVTADGLAAASGTCRRTAQYRIRRLRAEGYLAPVDVETTGPRGQGVRAEYTLTDTGRAALTAAP